MSERGRLNSEGRTLLRVARELREFLRNAPPDDQEARSLLKDADVLERVGRWLSAAVPIEATAGIPAAGPDHSTKGTATSPDAAR